MKSVETKIRKYQSILICSGIGVILFGVWSIVRLVLMVYMDEAHLLNLIGASDMMTIRNDIDVETIKKVAISFSFAFLTFDLIARIYIGMSAIKEGRGQYKKRITYIVIAVICALISVSADVNEVVAFFRGKEEFESFLSAAIDISIHVASIEIIVAAIKVRALNKKLSLADSNT